MIAGMSGRERLEAAGELRQMAGVVQDIAYQTSAAADQWKNDTDSIVGIVLHEGVEGPRAADRLAQVVALMQRLAEAQSCYAIELRHRAWEMEGRR